MVKDWLELVLLLRVPNHALLKAKEERCLTFHSTVKILHFTAGLSDCEF